MLKSKATFSVVVEWILSQVFYSSARIYKSNIQTYKKAAFSVAWMKFSSNFHPGKSTHERTITERILKNLNDRFSAAAVDDALCVLHEHVF